jgi:uncharacterized NAD(P)/FAD-binding protein YdhS
MVTSTSGLRDSKIAIVGGGCSGLLTAVQLIRSGFRGRLTVIEPREQLGAGLAYSTTFDQHLLNVTAGKMSALSDQPSDFLNWLREEHLPQAATGAFAPRKLYGKYLREVLRRALATGAHSHFSHIRAEATGVHGDAGGVHLVLSDGNTVPADKVVLALGNPASSTIPGIPTRGVEARWYLSPWFGDALQVRFSGERILLLGTGLTAVDSALALHSQKAGCRVYMLSRRGILPETHDSSVSAGIPPVLLQRGNLRGLLREMRGLIQAARQADSCWRTVVDAMRSVSNELWQELPAADQRRFLRHLRPYWETHRHRMAPEIRARLDRYITTSALQIFRGRLREARWSGGVGQVRIVHGTGGQRTLKIDRIINCTGIHESYTDNPRPLIQSLVDNGLAQANELGIGFRTDRHGALLNGEMRPSPVFFTLGPPRRGELFETTAVPEIRAQAEVLAAHVLRQTHIHPPVEVRLSPAWQPSAMD